jgi:hypothetical protein
VSFAGAVGSDPAAMGLDDLARDRQTEPKTAVPPMVVTPKSFEDMGQELAPDADSVVADAQSDKLTPSLHIQLDSRVTRRKLDGIHEEIRDHLLEPLQVSAHLDRRRGNANIDLDLLVLRRSLDNRYRARYHGRDIDPFVMDAQPPVTVAGGFDKILDQPPLRGGAAKDRGDGLPHLLGCQVVVLFE